MAHVSEIDDKMSGIPKVHHAFFSARQTLKRYATGGNVLIFATVLALIVANIPGINTMYNDFWNQEMR